MSNIVTVGLLSVEFFDDAAVGPDALITCGRVSLPLSRAAGQLFFDALTEIHEALLAADAVLRDDQAPPGPVTKSEVHLAKLLVDLDILQSKGEE